MLLWPITEIVAADHCQLLVLASSPTLSLSRASNRRKVANSLATEIGMGLLVHDIGKRNTEM